MSFPVPHHDHTACVTAAMAAAEEQCRSRGARLTDIRRRVLELVWDSHKPVGAYALLDALAKDGWSAAPPTVYRALDFLQAHGLVHRIALFNAFVGCSHPGHHQAGQFLLCGGCGSAVELEDQEVDGAITAAAKRNGFSVTRQTIEIEGLCSQCREKGRPS